MAKYSNSSTTNRSMGHRGKIPATIANNEKKLANLPTDIMMVDYPPCMYMPQYVGDSIVEIDTQLNNGVRGGMKQNLSKKY
jgi:hypothetical protein